MQFRSFQQAEKRLLEALPRRGMALVAGEWASTPCSVVGQVVTVTPVAGAQLYSVCWFPLYTVIARRPARGQDDGTASHSWTITWEQV